MSKAEKLVSELLEKIAENDKLQNDRYIFARRGLPLETIDRMITKSQERINKLEDKLRREE